jgi:hypothetical protein
MRGVAGFRIRVLEYVDFGSAVFPRMDLRCKMSQYQLTSQIIALSVADNWDEAKLEWKLHGIHFEDEPQTCLCGHFPIKEICTIRNKENGAFTDVGNCCVKKFLGLPSDNIFQAIKRIRKDDTKALNIEAILHAHERGWITDWERGFYMDTMRKQVLSPKQRGKRQQINQRVLHRLAARQKSPVDGERS